MSAGPPLEQGSFASTFPDRFASAMDRAKGVMEGVRSGLGGDNSDLDALARLHEIYRLRVELELETAGVLWRTAEVVCALTDVASVLSDAGRGPGDGARALVEAGSRRSESGLGTRSPFGGRPEFARSRISRPAPAAPPPEPARPAPPYEGFAGNGATRSSGWGAERSIPAFGSPPPAAPSRQYPDAA